MRYLGGVLAILLLPASLLTGVPAARADVGPDQAQALTAEFRDWLRGMVGPSLALPDLTVTAEGDHYRLTIPTAGLGGPDMAITARLRPLDAARWAAEDIRLPADTSLTTRMPRGKDDIAPIDMHVHLTIAGQDSHAEIDPTLATASTLVTALTGIAVDSEAGGRRRSQRFDSYKQTLTVRPAAPGKLDIDEDGVAEGWKSAQELPDGRAMAAGAARLSGSIHIVGLDRSQGATLGPVIGALASAPAPERNERLRALVVALHGLLTSLTFDETVEKMQIAVPGQGTAVIDRLHLGIDGAAPAGNLATSLTLGLDGLGLPDLSPTTASLAPKHVRIGVSVAGLSAEAVNDLALAALAPGANRATLTPQIAALFADPGNTGGPRVGIDTLGFDVGPAQVEAHGSVVAISQADLRGTARIMITGFDALTDKIREDPQLRQALPFMILARGMARTEGTALIWDIVFTPTGVTVNGVDPRTLLMQPKRPRPPPLPGQQP